MPSHLNTKQKTVEIKCPSCHMCTTHRAEALSHVPVASIFGATYYKKEFTKFMCAN